MKAKDPLQGVAAITFLLAVIVWTIAGVGCLRAQEAGVVFTAPFARDGIDLSGDWHYSIDPVRSGLADYHGKPPSRAFRRYDLANPENVVVEDPLALFEVDMRRAPTMPVPSSWLNFSPELRHYRGLMWFAREFELAPTANERYFVHFGAANYKASVYLNGHHVGSHEGGFTPFALEISDRIVAGTNWIVVGVDSERDRQSVPPTVTDWETYGGLTREIKLIRTPEQYVGPFWIRLTQQGRIVASGRVDGSGVVGSDVVVEIPELSYRLVAKVDPDGRWATSAPAPSEMQVWSPDEPKLYNVEIRTGDDWVVDQIGFRTIETQNGKILLNGEPITLYGVSLHEEELGTDPGRQMSDEAIRTLFRRVRDGLNGNFVRLAHYPHSEAALRLADEMGLLVWSEIPIYWLVDFESEHTLKIARNMLKEAVVRDRNRASVILWAVANETPISKQRVDFLSSLVSDLRYLDDSRLVTAALRADRRRESGQVTKSVKDPIAEVLDVISVNTYDGWYGGMPVEAVSEISWEIPDGKPFILSEFGAGALAGFIDADRRRKFSEAYQADYFSETLEMASKIENLSGLAAWLLKDFRSPRRLHPVYQNGWNRKGLIDETGQEKAAFSILSEFYRSNGDVVLRFGAEATTVPSE